MKLAWWIPLFGLLLMVGGGWWWMSRGSAPEEAPRGLEWGAAPEVTPPSTANGGSAPALHGLVEEPQQNQEVRTNVEEVVPEVSREEQAREPIADRHPVLWVEGRVELPEGTPPDEVLEVVARGKVFEWDRHGRREHRVAVQRNGTFRVAVAVDSKAATLRLYGKYCYLRRAQAWNASEEGELVLEPRLGAAVDVYLQAPGLEGEPPGFSAELSGLRNETHDLAPTWKAGNRLELRGLPPSRSIQLRAKAEGYGNLRFDFSNLEAGTHTEQTLTFVEEAVVEGAVVDQLGQPVDRGQVRVTVADEDGDYRIWDDSLNSTFDVVDGRYRAVQLPAGNARVSFEGKGYTQPETIELELRAGTTIERTLRLHSGQSIRGTVHWASGEPAVGVKVRLLGETTPFFMEKEGPTGTAIVDAEGQFEFTGFEDHEEYGLIAEGLPPNKQPPADLSRIKARRWERENRVLTRADGVRPGGLPVALVLGLETGQVQGRVLDDTGKPIDRFRIVAVPKLSDDLEELGAGQQRHSFDDPDGRFVLQGLPTGPWVLRASAARHKDGEPVVIEVPTNDTARLMLPRAAMIQGRVVDSKGNPVKASVRAMLLDEHGQEMEWSRDTRKSTDATELLGFTLNGLDAGRWRVVAERHIEGKSPPWEGTVVVGQQVDDLELRLPSPGQLEGTLHRDWLQGDMQVEARFLESDGDYGSVFRGDVQNDGRFSVGELPAGDYRVSVERSVEPEGVSYSRQISLNLEKEVRVDSNRTTNVHFEGRPADSLVLVGRLLQGEETVPKRILEFRGLEPKRDQVQAFSESDGQYRVVLEGPGTYTVRMRDHNNSSGSRTWRIEVQGRGEVRQDLLLPGGRLKLVTLLEGGGPFPGRIRTRSLQLVGGDGQGAIRPVRSTEEGVFFEGLAEGEYSLLSRAIPEGGQHYVVVSPESITVRGDGTEQVESIVLGLGCVLEGTVSDAEAQDNWLAAYRQAEGGTVVDWARIEDGRFRFEGLPAGEIWLDLRWQGGEGERVPVILTRGSPAHVEL